MMTPHAMGSAPSNVGVAPERPALLVVDDDVSVLTALSRTLSTEPYAVFVAESPKMAMRLLERERVAVVLSDYDMPEMNGIDFLLDVRGRFPDVQRILFTAMLDPSVITDAINRAEIHRVVLKPWDAQALRWIVRSAIDHFRMRLDNERLSRLTENQNLELKELNKDLEARIARRTLQLQRAKHEWERTFDAIVDPVAIVNDRYEVVRANVAYARFAGMDVQAVPGRTCHQVLADRSSPCTGCTLPAAIKGRVPRSIEIPAKQRLLAMSLYPVQIDAPPVEATGDLRTADIRAGLPSAVCHYRDVTEERTLQGALARTQKLASLGLFVGGVAHEINNPLGGILAFTQLLLRSHPPRDELERSLKDIEQSALRCKRIIESLLAFSHGSESKKTMIDLGPIARGALMAFVRDYAPSSKFDYSVAQDLPFVRGDPELIHQLLRNLLQNAEHAMQGRQGKVVLQVSNGQLNGRPAVMIEVIDQGTGIAEAQLIKIFDPFFTTKTRGQGTGLGLSICHRIVEQHGGTIEVASEVGKGTTFRVRLPAEKGSAQA
jgi:two-component system, NtrC family, sensor kinase